MSQNHTPIYPSIDFKRNIGGEKEPYAFRSSAKNPEYHYYVSSMQKALSTSRHRSNPACFFPCFCKMYITKETTPTLFSLIWRRQKEKQTCYTCKNIYISPSNQDWFWKTKGGLTLALFLTGLQLSPARGISFLNGEMWVVYMRKCWPLIEQILLHDWTVNLDHN